MKKLILIIILLLISSCSSYQNVSRVQYQRTLIPNYGFDHITPLPILNYNIPVGNFGNYRFSTNRMINSFFYPYNNFYYYTVPVHTFVRNVYSTRVRYNRGVRYNSGRSNINNSRSSKVIRPARAQTIRQRQYRTRSVRPTRINPPKTRSSRSGSSGGRSSGGRSSSKRESDG